jgi:hypothetical protein
MRIFVGDFLLEKIPFYFSEKLKNRVDYKIGKPSRNIDNDKDISNKNLIIEKIFERTVRYLVDLERYITFGVHHKFFLSNSSSEEGKTLLNIMKFNNIQYNIIKIENSLFSQDNSFSHSSDGKFSSEVYSINSILKFLTENRIMMEKSSEDIFIDYSQSIFLDFFLKKLNIVNMDSNSYSLHNKSEISLIGPILSTFTFVPSPTHPSLLYFLSHIFHLYPFTLLNDFLGLH